MADENTLLTLLVFDSMTVSAQGERTRTGFVLPRTVLRVKGQEQTPQLKTHKSISSCKFAPCPQPHRTNSASLYKFTLDYTMVKRTTKEIAALVRHNEREAAKLSVSYQLKLERIEGMVRKELAEDDDPRMEEEVRNMLRRQLGLGAEDALKLYPKLEAMRPEKLRDEELSKKREEARRARPKPTPTLAKAIPPGPSNPPPGLSRGLKRGQSFGTSHPAKKTSFVPCVGDWQCGKCQYWNKRWNFECRGLGDTCGVSDWQPGAKNKVQQAGEGVPAERKSGAIRQGDWVYRSGHWGRSHWTRCDMCHKPRAECQIGHDFDDNLPEDHLAPVEGYPASRDYWGGELHSEAYNGSSTSRQQRTSNAPPGVFGRYVEKKK